MALELTVTENEDFFHDPNEWHPATLDRIEEDEGQYGPSLKWIFILDGEDNREEWAWTSQNLSPKSKAYKWIKGIYGTGPAAGAVVDLGKLFGERVAIMFEHDGEGDAKKERIDRIKGLDEPKVEPAAPPVTNKDLPF